METQRKCSDKVWQTATISYINNKTSKQLPLGRCESLELQCKWLLPDKWPQFSKYCLRDLGGENREGSKPESCKTTHKPCHVHRDLLY